MVFFKNQCKNASSRGSIFPCPHPAEHLKQTHSKQVTLLVYLLWTCTDWGVKHFSARLPVCSLCTVIESCAHAVSAFSPASPKWSCGLATCSVHSRVTILKKDQRTDPLTLQEQLHNKSKGGKLTEPPHNSAYVSFYMRSETSQRAPRAPLFFLSSAPDRSRRTGRCPLQPKLSPSWGAECLQCGPCPAPHTHTNPEKHSVTRLNDGEIKVEKVRKRCWTKWRKLSRGNDWYWRERRVWDEELFS